jgi:hypothetical protein
MVQTWVKLANQVLLSLEGSPRKACHFLLYCLESLACDVQNKEVPNVPKRSIQIKMDTLSTHIRYPWSLYNYQTSTKP